ncbi:hypothetical protein GGTG_13933 [Gaeumannomyces tritici R3-111a-1]|uniref:Uncharacterized protein n=1 Tax=Gaeumannomyces tritici (strain R3-111a-1) TaxID=644352 RepID=J3PK84_GAET3|nr:hypothetical protein GGTG_13933 [Gaeumannomyces tritici R3-111a-1]EJT68491.1 hypothetical protein GGTG_13933 [Gaeumannomyces tritici R3-111a-1]
MMMMQQKDEAVVWWPAGNDAQSTGTAAGTKRRIADEKQEVSAERKKGKARASPKDRRRPGRDSTGGEDAWGHHGGKPKNGNSIGDCFARALLVAVECLSLILHGPQAMQTALFRSLRSTMQGICR